MTASQVSVILLAIIAGWVSIRQWRHGDRKVSLTWLLIVLYWVVLTAKNIFDYFKI